MVWPAIHQGQLWTFDRPHTSLTPACALPKELGRDRTPGKRSWTANRTCPIQLGLWHQVAARVRHGASIQRLKDTSTDQHLPTTAFFSWGADDLDFARNVELDHSSFHGGSGTQSTNCNEVVAAGCDGVLRISANPAVQMSLYH
jgi:hypothetical protein